MQEQILKVLQDCSCVADSCIKKECPYYEESDFPIDTGECLKKLHKDIYELLTKEVAPNQTDEYHFYCGICNRRLRTKLNLWYCPRCGVKIKWPQEILQADKNNKQE